MDLNEILDTIIEKEAYEAHLQVGIPPILRINGELVPMQGMLSNESIIEYTAKITNNTLTGLGTHLIKYGENTFIASLYQSYGQPAISMRRCVNSIPTLNEVNAPAIFEKVGNLRSGLLLITGSTGSGKSTSAYSLIGHINLNSTRHIFSIENTVFYQLSHKMSVMKQLCIGADCSDQTDGIRIAAQSGADVILLDDIVSHEAARLVLDLSHYTVVIVVMHAEDSSDAIQNLLWKIGGNETQARYQLSNALYAIMVQKLLPKKNREGRVAAYEIAINNSDFKIALRNGATDFTKIISNTDGMCTLQQAYQHLVDANLMWEDDIPRAF